MSYICSSIVVSTCVYVCPHYRKVGSVYDVYHHIFSLVRSICVEYTSYILSKYEAAKGGFTLKKRVRS